MAVEREASKEDMSSFVSLLKTFLPDHNELPLTGSTEELLNHVKGSMHDNTSPECKQAARKDGHSICQQLLGSQAQGYNNQLFEDANDSRTFQKMSGSIQNNTLQNSVSNNHLDLPKKLVDDNFHNEINKSKSDLEKAAGNGSHAVESDYDSDATIDLEDAAAINYSSSLPGKNETTTDSPFQDVAPPYLKNYACFVCDQTFQDLLLYGVHMQCHYYKTGNITCRDCCETLDNKALYIAHRKLATYEIWTNRVSMTGTPTINKTEESGTDGATKKKKQKKARDSNYVCSVCGLNFNKYTAFLKHVEIHKDALAFPCAVCLESFRAPCMLRYHIDVQHSHVLPFQCRRCLRRFKLKCSLSTHLRYCDVDPTSLPFAEEMQFIDHLSQQRRYLGVEGENDDLSQYSCPVCTLMFDSPEDLKNHMNHHDETKPYKCDICGRGFRSKYVLRKHAPVHETKHECRCEICGVQLLTLSGYNAHLRGHRNQEKIQAKFFPELINEDKKDADLSKSALEILEKIKTDKKEPQIEGNDEPKTEVTKVVSKKLKTYKCPLCNMFFFSGGMKFQMHARKEHKDAVFEKCETCNKSFVGKDNLEKHVKLHKMFADSYSCDECGKTFRRKFALQVHKKMHSFKKFVKCDICGQEFRFVSEVDKHKNKKHRYDRIINIYKCGICGQQFPMLSHLSVHCYCHNMPDAKPFACDLCKVSYKSSVELKKHIFEKHDKLMKEFGDSTYIDAMVMDIDGASVSQTQVISKEVKTMNDSTASLKNASQASTHDDSKDDGETTDDMSTKESETSNSDRKVPCDETALPSNVEAYNLATRQFYHQTKFLKRYICEVCQKAFSSNSDLKTHRRTHSGETPFKCEYCDRSFKQRGHRKLHTQVVHTKEMPYKCDLCDSSFPTRYRYQIHVKRHSGVREHQCAYCEKGFYTLGKMNEHKKKRHPEEWKDEQKEREVCND